MKKLLSVLLALALALSLGSAALAYNDLSGVSWTYEDGNLTAIGDADGTIENVSVLMISSEADGEPVTGVVSNGFDNVVVGHKANEYILIADGIQTISAKAFYDFNFVSAVSIPASVTEIDTNAFDVLGREIGNATVIYGAAGSAAETWAADNSTASYAFEAVDGTNFSVTAGVGGSVYPAGAYYVPDTLKDAGAFVGISITADHGYAIDVLTVDGAVVADAAGQSEYLLDYAFSGASEAISVTFAASAAGEASGESSGEASGENGASDESASDEITIIEGVEVYPEAVAEGMDISDIYLSAESSTSGYTASMGLSTGDYYVYDGALYQMVFGTNGSGENGDCGVVLRCKAEVINYLYDTFGWVYGEDYDLVRIYQYSATVNGGNRKGTYDYHCAYAYQLTDDSGEYANLSGAEAFYSENENTAGITNYDTLFVQGDADTPVSVVVTNLSANCFTRPDGPQEATNFYGLGAAVLVDGGTPAKDTDYAETVFDDDDVTSVTLVEPKIDGGANPLYVLASGLVHIEGGTMFTAYSGGHGPYASLQGQITINTDENIIDENGVVNTDIADLTENVLTARPGRLGWSVRSTYDDGTPVDANDYSVVHAKFETDDDAIEAYEAENGPVTVVSTANSSGSLLVTDSGGGIIVANKLSGTAYSTGSSGIYSMGGGSYVYLYNSYLESHIEPGMNSVGEGYIFAFNSEVSGPIGILSSGGSDHVRVYNSKVSTNLDFDMDFYDMTDPNDKEQLAAYTQLTEEVDANELVNSNFLMIFPLNGDDMSNFVDNWFTDRTQVPGKNGGNIAVISATSASGITIDSTLLENNAYAAYADEGVPNWLVSVQGSGTVINFRNENSSTLWDLTGAENTTTELYGNLYCAATTGSGMWATAPGAMTVNMENSEWTGTIENAGEGVTLNLDAKSVWTVTGTCTVASLTLEDGAVVQAPEGCTLTFSADDAEYTELPAGTYTDLHILVTDASGAAVYDGLYTELTVAASAESASVDAS